MLILVFFVLPAWLDLPLQVANLSRHASPALYDQIERDDRLLFGDAAASTCASWIFQLPPQVLARPLALQALFGLLAPPVGTIQLSVEVFVVTRPPYTRVRPLTLKQVCSVPVPATLGQRAALRCPLGPLDAAAGPGVEEGLEVALCREAASPRDTASGALAVYQVRLGAE